MISSTPSVLGVDLGTSSVKAAAVTLGGAVLGLSSVAVATHRESDGRVEQDMDEVWLATARAIAEVTARVPTEVLAVGLAGQGDGAWFIDKSGAPVCRAATWMDGRAAAVLERWRADGRAAELEHATRSTAFPGALPILASWWKERRPSEYARVRAHLNAKDWIGYRLTGVMATDPTEAARIAFPLAQWPDGDLAHDAALLERLGVGELAELLAPIQSSTSVRGALSSAVSGATGLRPGTPVTIGAMDGVASALGLGVENVGDGFAVLGTTASYGCLASAAPESGQSIGICIPDALGKGFQSTLAPASGAPTLGWLRDTLAPGAELEQLGALAEQSPYGANGVTFLPHLSTGGERAPFVDGAMRGALLGLSFASTRADIARAGYEGMAYVMAECFDRLPPVQGIVLGGGASRSRLLGQILADVTGVPIALPGVGEPGVLGAARLAGLAIGVEIPRAGLARLYQPLPAATELYSERRERVARSRQAVRDISTPRTKD